jgi:hypothetical protein
MYLARIAVDEYKLDDEKIGWLRVHYKGQLRWAMPKMRFGAFEMPSKEWVEKYGNLLGVWIVGQTTPDEREREAFLVWDGFAFLPGKVPQEAVEGFPYVRMYFTENWTMLFSDKKDENRFVLKHLDGSLIVIDRKTGEESIKIEDAVHGHSVVLDKNGVKVVEGSSSNEFVMDKDGNLNVTVNNDATVNVSGDTTVNATGKVVINGSTVEMNGALGVVLTDKTATPACLFTGKPFPGVPTVKAG